MTLCPRCGESNPTRARFCLACGVRFDAAATLPRETRRTVTIVFADVAGSTALSEHFDSEAVRVVMGRYFSLARTAVERHGGTVEKFIGDAVMAVFGVPVRHEDDPLRALRAAVEIRREVASLSADVEREWGVAIQVRIGVQTGEVVAEGSLAETFVTGDAVNTAARLEQLAAPGEIVIGSSTFRLAGRWIETEALGPIVLKGKAGPVEAHRVLGLRSTPSAGMSQGPFLGRDKELERLRRTATTVISDRRCLLVTVLGPAGIGKSRLVMEVAAELRARSKVLRGACPSYGAGITYAPISDIVRNAAGIADDSREVARRKLGTLCAMDEEGRRTASVLASAIGLDAEPIRQEEVARSTRQLLERLARTRPLVVVIDDIHWAEGVFLDMLEYLEREIDGAPVLLLCSARPDLVEDRPKWASRPSESLVVLEPLSAIDTERLAESRAAALSEAEKRRVTETAAGNPLFAEQLLAMLTESGSTAASLESRTRRLSLPPTIEALLAARLDRLTAEERLVLEAAAVGGEVAPMRLLEALLPRPLHRALPAIIRSLSDKDFVRLQTELGERICRFSHALVQDATYAGVVKSERQRLHEAVANWYENEAAQGGRESPELIGYHLEQAYHARMELRPPDAVTLDLANRAATHLAEAGRRAFKRGDMPAARNLLDRAADVLPPEEEKRVSILPDLGKALLEVGETSAARNILEAAVRTARLIGDQQSEAYAQVHASVLRVWIDSSFELERERAELERVITVFERFDDLRGLALAWGLRAELEWFSSEPRRGHRSIWKAVDYARRAGDVWLHAEYLALATGDPYDGVTARQAARRCHRVLNLAPDSAIVAARALPTLAVVRAMQLRAEQARRCYGEGLRHCRELGLEIWFGEMAALAAWAEYLLGDLSTAESLLVDGLGGLERVGDRVHLSYLATMRAYVSEAKGDLGEALKWSERAQAASPTGSDPELLGIQARIRAALGERREAERLASDAVRLSVGRGQGWVGLAHLNQGVTLHRCGRHDAATATLEKARSIFTRIGDRAGVAQVNSAVTTY